MTSLSVGPQLWQDWRDRATQRQVLALALPMIVANISVPALALTQNAIAGHLPIVNALGAIAAGNAVYLLAIAVLGGLRMGLTGLVAQAVGRHDNVAVASLLWQGLLLALLLAALALALIWPLAPYLIDGLHASSTLRQAALGYLRLRIWGLPAALANFVLTGWLIGCRRARTSLVLAWMTQLAQIIACLLLTSMADWGLRGLAIGAVAGQYMGVASGFFCCLALLRRHAPSAPLHLFDARAWRDLFTVNCDLFIRSLALQTVFFALPWLGAWQGELALAANALLLNGLELAAFMLDGFANALEVLAGHAFGARDPLALRRASVITAGWGFLLSLAFSALFLFAGPRGIDLLTDLPAVRQQALAYLPWLVALPPIAVASYLLDGFFIGAGRVAAMRNSMLIAVILFFVLIWILRHAGNTGIWLGFLVFMALRGLGLSIAARWLWHRPGML